MEGGSALNLFLFFQAIAVFFAEVNADPIFSRLLHFKTRENKQLKGYVVKRIESPSLVSYDQQCMRYTWCTSTNERTHNAKVQVY